MSITIWMTCPFRCALALFVFAWMFAPASGLLRSAEPFPVICANNLES